MENGYFTSDASIRDLYHNIIREISKKKTPAIGYAGLRSRREGPRITLSRSWE